MQWDDQEVVNLFIGFFKIYTKCILLSIDKVKIIHYFLLLKISN